VRWKSLCADHPEIDRRRAERFFTRTPEAFLNEWTDEQLIGFMTDWEAAQGDPPIDLGVLAEGGGGFSFIFLGELYRGAIACVLGALEDEGFHVKKLTLWTHPQPPRSDAAVRPLFVVEADLVGPPGVEADEATRRMFHRLRPAFAQLKQGDAGQGQPRTAAEPVCFPDGSANGQIAPSPAGG
jgi:hypothetical protein